MIMAKDSNNNYVKIEDIEAKNNNEYQDIEKIVSKQGNLLYNKYKETEDTLPINFKGKGKDLTDYRIYGNTADGESVGDRTGNLFNEGLYDKNTAYVIVYVPIYVGNVNSVTCSTTCPMGTQEYKPRFIFILTGSVSSGAANNTNGVSINAPLTVAPTDGYVTIAYRQVADIKPWDYHTMLNTGSEPLPYEPYGYKVPVTVSNGTDTLTTPIYLPEPLKMVGDEAEYIDYREQKMHRVRKNLVQTIATSQTINDITFTVNANGSVTCNGTNHGNNPIIFELNNPDVVFPEGVYITSGCPAGGSITSGYKIQYFNGSSWNYELGSGSTFTLSGNLKYRSRILISKDVTVTNLTFYPMLRLASIEDDTYEPYIENTDLDVTLPALPTLTGTNVLSVETEVQPSKVYLKGKLKRTIYGWHVDPDVSDSSNAITYLKDAIGMIPASMGSSTFNYGSWQNAFFMPKPCMLKSNGKVDYYLDPNDYTKKLNGTASDISNSNYDGNAMMQWPKIWFKYVKGVKEGQGYFYVANYKADGNYHCWCNYDSEDNEIDHFYTAIYNGTSFMNYKASKTYVVNDFAVYDNKLYKCNTDITTAEKAFDSAKWNVVSNTAPAIDKMRSLSGIRLTSNNGNTLTTTTMEVTRAEANNATIAKEWYIETFSDRLLINGLLVLMGKSLNTQAIFGRGLDSGSRPAKEAYITGALNDKGLFYGVTENGNSAVKVFGMENFWGCVGHRTAGLIIKNNIIKLKLTYGIKDGSTIVGYNQTGNGYIDNDISLSASGYVQKMLYNKYGFTPAVASIVVGGQLTQYADFYSPPPSDEINYAIFGGSSEYGQNAGAFQLDLRYAPVRTHYRFAASLSCKPLL